MKIEKKTVEEWLNTISYENDPDYVPSDFALEFINFIKLIHGEEGSENKSPVIHYRMLDNIQGKRENTANMCHRGIAKTTLLAEYLFLYIAVYGDIPGFGHIDYALYVSDSIENGVKKMRLRLQRQCENSAFLQKYLTEYRFTDIRWYFKNAQKKEFVVTGHGAQALSLSSTLYTPDGTTTMGDVQVGDHIYGPDGKLTKVIDKSEIFHRPMYELQLDDGRTLRVSEDHINSVLHWGKEKDITTQKMLDYPLFRKKKNGTKNYSFQIKNTEPLEYPTLPLPSGYVVGALLGDGSIKPDGSVTLCAHKDDIDHYINKFPYQVGTRYVDKRNTNVISVSFLKAYKDMEKVGLRGVSCLDKFIPEMYFYTSVSERLELLRGLIDTDGSVSKEGKVTFTSTSYRLVEDVVRLVRSLGGTAKIWEKYEEEFRKNPLWKVGIWLNFSTASIPRKANKEKFNKSHNVAITGISRIETEPSQCIAVDNDSHQYLADNYTRTHNTGVRGTVELGTRPQLAVLDDLLSDDDAKSPTIIQRVEDTVYSAIDYALHPNKRKTIWSGTPFNAKDPLYKAVESGAWYVNVYPVCEKFPCTREEFRGSWSDRFDYDYVYKQYTKAKAMGKLDSFNQELMLRIMSDEDRLIEDIDIVWYKYRNLLRNKGAYNYYITTDFATSDKEHADFSVINVWGYSQNGEWLWVDGFCKRALMNESIDNLFRLVQQWNPQEVGIEVTGQQGGFISWIQSEMMNRNIMFTISTGKTSGNTLGIRPSKDKMSRFQQNAIPLFKSKKIWLPEDYEESPQLIEMINELTLATFKGFKSKHDDVIDTISMLPELNAWRPSEVSIEDEAESSYSSPIWEEEDTGQDSGSSYFV